MHIYCVPTVSMAADSSFMPGTATLDDKIRMSASKGHVDRLQELVSQGPVFDTDAVSSTFRYKFHITTDVVKSTLINILYWLREKSNGAKKFGIFQLFLCNN